MSKARMSECLRNIKSIKNHLEDMSESSVECSEHYREMLIRDLHYNMVGYNHLAGMVIYNEVQGCTCDFCKRHPVK